MKAFNGLLEQLAAEHAALQHSYEQANAEIATLRSQLLSLNRYGFEKAAWSARKPTTEAELMVEEVGQSGVRKPLPRHFLHDAQHLMLPPDATSSWQSAPMTHQETRNSGIGMMQELHQREFKLKHCFNITDEDLRFLRPRVYDLDSAMQDFEQRQKEEKRHAAFRNMVLNKEQIENEQCVGCIMGPLSKRRLCWDLAGLVMVSCDVIMTPLDLIVDDHPWIKGLGWTMNVFWTLDIGMNFCTGYFAETELIMDCMLIAVRYVSTWFLFDVLVILPDWITLFFEQGENVGNSVSTLRTLKIIRMFRLMRLVKIRRVVGDLICRVQSDALLKVIRSGMLMLAIVACLHVIACFWYLVGKADGGWVSKLGSEDSDAEGYLVALHWALSLMQGTTWSLTPLTIGERFVTVIVLPIALALTALFIACTTIMMQQSTDVARDLAGQRLALRSVVRHYKLPVDLHVRMRRFIEADKSLHELRKRERRLLKDLPPDLQKDLKMQIYGLTLARHAFIRFLMSRNPHFVRHLCSILEIYDFIPSEFIFYPGDACTAVRFVFDGQMQYVHGHDLDTSSVVQLEFASMTGSLEARASTSTPHIDSADRVEHSLRLARGKCVSEPSLWTLWEHCGELAALTFGSCAMLESNRFDEVVKLYPMVMWLSVLYSRQFIIHMNKNVLSDIMEPPDVGSWEPEAIEAIAEQGAGLPFEDELPSQCRASVVKACVRLAQDVAANGLDENRPHHGFTLIVGDERALATCGKSGFNPFQAHDVRVIDENGFTSSEAIETLRRNAFHTDGAIVVDGQSGRVVASSWFVGDIRLGGMEGGARSRSARAIAQQAGGCYVIKCSEDSRGKLILHLHTNTRIFNSKLEVAGEC